MSTRKKSPSGASKSTASKSSKLPDKSGKPTSTRGHSKATPAADMPDEVVEIITAHDEYKRKHQRPFPNWSEVLEIVKALGYERT
jgi:hypothetical protein